jgi:hypothetical protein
MVHAKLRCFRGNCSVALRLLAACRRMPFDLLRPLISGSYWGRLRLENLRFDNLAVRLPHLRMPQEQV